MISAYNTPKSTFYQVVKDTCDAILSVLCLPGLPESETALRQSAEAYTVSRKPESPLSGCLGALDGIAIKIRKPETDLNLAAYWCRKITTLYRYKPLLMQTIVFCVFQQDA